MRVSQWRFCIRPSLCCGGAAIATLLAAGNAEAQVGNANVPLPNVLLLQDTSGSFEYMIDGNPPEKAGEGGTCSPGVASNPNRWGVAVEALTGNIQPFYSCAAMDRTQQGFVNQYSISTGAGGSLPPYDYNYYLPFHRPISQNGGVSCAYTPYALPGAAGGGVGLPPNGPMATSGTDCNGGPCTALGFPPDAIGTYPFETTGSFGGAAPVTGECAPAACAPANAETNNTQPSCTFVQAPNGAIDGAATLMRFGLMTFDNDPGTGTGSTPSVLSPIPANTTASAFDGQWSYFFGWNTGSTGATGWPAGCTGGPTTFFELGARNPAAPPWEGRLVTFPNQAADTTATVENNQLVQLAIAAMRPYGATPMSAMFDDAEEYLWQDPAGPQKSDLFVQGGCRQQFIIVLTDGAPNQDLGVTESLGTAGTCNGTVGGHAGKCPYQPAWQAAQSLFAGSDPLTGRAGQSVTTYVIGFAVSTNITPPIPPGGAPLANCSALAKSGTDYTVICAPDANGNPTIAPTQNAYACCMLQQIAAAGQGGTGQAYFADTPGDLNAALGAVLGQIAKQLAPQTLPTYSPSVSYGGASGQGLSSMFLSSFNGAVVPWRGDVQRQEIECQAGPSGLTPTPVAENTLFLGDDFNTNLQGVAPSARKFMTYQLPTPGTGAQVTIRPFLTAPDDGIPEFGQSGQEVGLSPGNITSMTNLATELSATNTSCENPVTHAYTIPAAGCANVGLNFAMAQISVVSQDTSTPSFDTLFQSRCPAVGSLCNPLGAILHSTPTYSLPPSALLRDDSFQSYATGIAALGVATAREPMLYVATIDGLLHAFDATIGLPGGSAIGTNNELWSFIPPGVFPNLISNYSAASNVLLDGTPVVKDIVWERDLGGTPLQWEQAWHTMLVAGFGLGGRGYYALDVTDPRNTNYTAVSNYSTFPSSCPSVACTGPHFQWQIASMNMPTSGAPTNQSELFGTTSATPAITTVFADPTTGGINPREIGIAILPGGSPGPPFVGPPCPRDLVANAGTYVPLTTYNQMDTNFTMRSSVRAWAKSCSGANSGVPGRSVTIVRIDTGDILAVFARPASSSPDVPTEIPLTKIIPTPFDSPMTGTPVVYPSDIGAIAQQVFIGDADGTMWRIDLTSTNPANWKAGLFFDSYNSITDIYNLTDSNHLAYDSQPISIPPMTTVDRQGNVTLQYATGDQTSYTANYTVPGSPNTTYQVINYVYSLKVTTTLPAGTTVSAMNWYLPLGTLPVRAGERVTGPMAVFDDTFYFATFIPPNPNAPSAPVCTGGTPNLYGYDYELPLAGCGSGPNEGNGATGCGGNPRDFLPTGIEPNPPDANGLPTVNVVIPGVSVAVTPTCTNTAAAATDPYTGGMHTAVSGTVPGTYSLMAQVAGKNTHTNAQNTVAHPLLAPNASTLVDSWATLAE
jgi:type IV pilus assembly protein PilY1